MHEKDSLWVLLVLPIQRTMESYYLQAKYCSFQLESSIFLQNNLLLDYSLQTWAFINKIGNIDSDEHVIVLVMLQGDSVTHQQQPVR